MHPMSSDSQHRFELVSLHKHGLGDAPGVGAGGRPQAPEVIATGNVVPFVRPQPPGAALTLDPSQRPAPDLPRQEGRGRIVGLLALSLVVHGGLCLAFSRAPEPPASIALPAISVEIVLGADTPAGVATTAQQQEVDTKADDPQAQPPEPETETAKQEAPPAEPRTPPVETAAPETPPEPPATREPQPVAPREEPQTAELAPPPPPPAAKPEPQPKPVQRRAAKPKQDPAAKPKQEPRTRTANLEPGATASPSASGVGIGRAGTDTNYRGLVFAHLARHKQFPADARGRGEQGSAMIGFSLDGGGRVTRVSLVRSSGFSSLDQEAQAMVRRASPFPAPPDGRAVSFTAPASFRIQ
jgi:protein TonB